MWTYFLHVTDVHKYDLEVGISYQTVYCLKIKCMCSTVCLSIDQSPFAAVIKYYVFLIILFLFFYYFFYQYVDASLYMTAGHNCFVALCIYGLCEFYTHARSPAKSIKQEALSHIGH